MILSVFFLLLFSSMATREKTTGLNASNPIQWMSIEEAALKAKAEPRKIIIDVYTDWCGWCKKMDNTTFKDGVIANYINKKYYAVKLNAEQRGEINLNGNTYKYVSNGRRGYHELAASLLQGKLSYPSIVFLDENLNMIQPIAGYQRTENLDQILKFFGENAYKKQRWEAFLKSYRSPF